MLFACQDDGSLIPAAAACPAAGQLPAACQHVVVPRQQVTTPTLHHSVQDCMPGGHLSIQTHPRPGVFTSLLPSPALTPSGSSPAPPLLLQVPVGTASAGILISRSSPYTAGLLFSQKVDHKVKSAAKLAVGLLKGWQQPGTGDAEQVGSACAHKACACACCACRYEVCKCVV